MTSTSRTDHPQVLALAPADPQDLLHGKLIDLLVEYGIYLEADAQDQLPTAWPDDLSGYRAVLLDEASPLARSIPPGVPRVVRYRRPASFDWHNERPCWIALNALLLAGDITVQHPAFLARNSARPDRDVILGQARASLQRDPQWWRMWSDASLVRLEGLWHAAELYDLPELKQQYLQCIDDALAAYQGAPLEGHGTTPAGLAKHPIYPAVLLQAWRATGNARYLDEALAVMETLDEARAIAEQWTHAAPVLQTESLDRKPWQWAMRAVWCAQPEFMVPAVAVMKAGYEVLFDPGKQLWAHYGQRGGARGLAWGRGQGWALFGLVGLLEFLPRDHADFALLCSWIDQTAEGFARTQDAATGLWHNLLDEPGTRLEVSATSKAVRHFARAWRLGLTRAACIPEMLARAWRGLKAHTFDHRTCNRCYGTGPGVDVAFYATLAAGGSPNACLLAGTEYVRTFGPLVA